MPSKVAVAAIIGCAFLLAACSGAVATPTESAGRPTSGVAAAAVGVSPVASAAPTGGDACSLLTLAEVSAAINFVVNKEIGDATGRTCTWTYADPNLMVGFNTARLDVIDPATFGITKSGPATGTAITPVDGLGDSAFYLDAGTGGTSLSVEKGSRAFTVSVLGTAYTTAQSESDEKTLAGYVLARI